MSKFDLAPHKRPAERNWFLSRLPRADYARLASELHELTFKAGQVLYEPGHTMPDTYFPETVIISVVCCPTSGRALEVAVIAHEGFVGPPLLDEPPRAISRFVVHQDGTAKRVRREALQDLLERSATARELATRSIQALSDQVMLCAACNIGHSPRERCARWLLMIHDRSGRDEFLVTQEVLGYMLGMTRQTVSGVAGQLQDEGSIEYRRGRVVIANREKLERLACPCYGTIRDRQQQLLS